MLDRQIGDYQLLRRLGSGGMADVYLASQLSLQRQVALKILKPEFTQDAAYVKRFVREAQAAAALVQSNIVQIYEVGQREGVHFIAQEYVAGRNLRQFIARYGAVQPAMALSVLRQVGQALNKAGEQGVTHRDIKPENIMISSSGEIKVADFGLARIQNSADQNNLTQVGIAMGTPLYMSPEQVEGRAVDPRSDIYSLGVTIWHMLAGYPPFQADTPLALALQHVRAEPNDLQQIRPDVPPELCQIVHRMMAKDPAARFANAAELLRELRKVQIDLDGEIDSLVAKLAETRHNAADLTIRDSSSALAATRQLQTLMKGNSLARRFWRRTVLAAVGLGLLATGIGGAMAWFSPPASLLENAGQLKRDAIPRQKTAEEQYRAAMWANSPEHFRAVEQYFPPDAAPEEQKHQTLLANRQAWMQLLKTYLRNRETYDFAWEPAYKLASADDTAAYFQASGRAGLAWLNDYIGDEDTAKQMLLKIEEYVWILDDSLREKVNRLLEKYGREMPGFGGSFLASPAKHRNPVQ